MKWAKCETSEARIEAVGAEWELGIIDWEAIDWNACINNQARLIESHVISEKVAEYAQAMSNKQAVFPAMVLTEFKPGRYRTVDGNHRLAALRKIGWNDDVFAYVVSGSNYQIELLTRSWNASNGVDHDPDTVREQLCHLIRHRKEAKPHELCEAFNVSRNYIKELTTQVDCVDALALKGISHVPNAIALCVGQKWLAEQPELQADIARLILNEGLAGRDAQQLIRRAKAAKPGFEMAVAEGFISDLNKRAPKVSKENGKITRSNRSQHAAIAATLAKAVTQLRTFSGKSEDFTEEKRVEIERLMIQVLLAGIRSNVVDPAIVHEHLSLQV